MKKEQQKPIINISVKVFFILSNGTVCDNREDAIETKNSK